MDAWAEPGVLPGRGRPDEEQRRRSASSSATDTAIKPPLARDYTDRSIGVWRRTMH